MVSVCLPSFALSQHLPSYLGFSYLGHGVSLHGCSSKVQPLLLTLDKVTPLDPERGVAPLDLPAPMQPLLLGRGLAPLHHSCTIVACCSQSLPLILVIIRHTPIQNKKLKKYLFLRTIPIGGSLPREKGNKDIKGRGTLDIDV